MKWTVGISITEIFLESVMSIQRIGHCTGFFPFGERQLTRIPACAQRISRAVQEERDNSSCHCVYHVLFHSILHSWVRYLNPIELSLSLYVISVEPLRAIGGSSWT